MKPTKHKVGDVVGEFTLLEYVQGRAQPRIMALWRCRCSCGQECHVQGNNLTNGATTSCGCARAAGAATSARTKTRGHRGNFVASQQEASHA